MTFTDQKLDRMIAGQQKLLSKVKPGSWTEGQLQKVLEYLLSQRSLPKEQRCPYQNGRL